MYGLVRSRLTEDGLLVSDVEASIVSISTVFMGLACTSGRPTGPHFLHVAGSWCRCGCGRHGRLHAVRVWRWASDMAQEMWGLNVLQTFSRSKCPGGIGPEPGQGW